MERDQDQPGGLRLRAGVPVPRCPGTVLTLGLWPGQGEAFTVERDQDQPGGLRLRLREGVPVQGRPGSSSGSGRARGEPSPWSRIRINRPGSARLTGSARTVGRVSRSRAFARVSGPAPAGFVLGLWPVQGEAFTVERDQPGGLRLWLREGVPVQGLRGPCSPWGSGRSRGKPSPWSGTRINRAGSGSGSGSGRVSRSRAVRVRPRALAGPGGSLHRGAGSGSTGRAPRG